MSEENRNKVEYKENGEARVTEASDGGVTISVPIQIKRRSGRRKITLPDGTSEIPRPWDTKPTSLQLALARGHRWLRMIESGKAQSLREIAEKEGVDNSYVSRMVNLTLLAPDIVATILDDALPENLTLLELASDPPTLWSAQRTEIIDKS